MNSLMKRIALPSLALGVALVMSACDTTNKTATTMSSAVSMGAVNSRCPVTGNKVAPGSTTTWNGQTVGFCCDDCISAWKNKSNNEKTTFVSQASN